MVHRQIGCTVAKVIVFLVETVRSRKGRSASRGRHHRDVVRVNSSISVRAGVNTCGTHQGYSVDVFSVRESSPIAIHHRKGSVTKIEDIPVIFLLRKGIDGGRSAVDHEISQIGKVEDIVVRIEAIAPGTKARDFKIIGMRHRIAGGGGIVPTTANHINRVNNLTIRQSSIAVQVSHGKGRVIEN